MSLFNNVLRFKDIALVLYIVYLDFLIFLANPGNNHCGGQILPGEDVEDEWAESTAPPGCRRLVKALLSLFTRY